MMHLTNFCYIFNFSAITVGYYSESEYGRNNGMTFSSKNERF